MPSENREPPEPASSPPPKFTPPPGVEKSHRHRGEWFAAAAKLFIVLLLVAITAWGVWRWKQAHDVATELAAIRAAGYPVTSKELDAWYPHVPDDQNAALGIVAAAAKLKVPGYDSDVPLFGKAELPKLGQRMDPAMRRRVDGVLRDNAAVLRAVEVALKKPKSRYPVDLSRGIDAPLSHLGSLRKMANLFELRAITAAEDGHANIAADAVLTSLRLAWTLDKEPTVLSFLVNEGLKELAVKAAQRAMSLVSLGPGDLDRIGRAMAVAYQPEGFRRAIAGNRAIDDDSIRRCGIGREEILLRWTGLLDHNWAVLLGRARSELAVMDLPATERQKEFDRIIRRQEEQLSLIDFLVKILADRPAMINTIDLRTAAAIAAARAGVMVCAWRLEGGELPADFGGFSESLRKGWPTDPFTDGPIRYRKLDRGFVVYSIGDDGVDDGGAAFPIRKGEERGDFAFRVLR